MAGGDVFAPPAAEVRGAIPVAGTVLLGRQAGRADVVLDHPHVSRLHAQLAVRGKRGTLSDLRSANGTFLNGRRLEGATPVRLGQPVLRTSTAGAAALAALAPRLGRWN